MCDLESGIIIITESPPPPFTESTRRQYGRDKFTHSYAVFINYMTAEFFFKVFVNFVLYDDVQRSLIVCNHVQNVELICSVPHNSVSK